jgi:Cu/Ag efflux protein CusF
VIKVKKMIVIIMAVLFIFAIASVSFPADKGAEMAKPAEKPKIKEITGEVKAVNTAARTIIITNKVKGREVETVVIVDKETNITMGKEKKTLADVKVGSEVSVNCTEVESKNVAKNIKIKPVNKIGKPIKETGESEEDEDEDENEDDEAE